MLGVWAHRQALAARDAGADVRVLVLHRPLPPLRACARRDARALRAAAAPAAARDAATGSPSTTCRYLSPPRPWSYGSWGAWAAPPLRRALRAAARDVPVRARPRPLRRARRRRGAPGARRQVAAASSRSHGGDVLGPRTRARAERGRARRSRHARLVLANSAGTARRCQDARRARRRASCTWAPTCRARRPRRTAPAPADARHRRPPGRAQAPRRRDRGAGPAARPPARAALRRRRRRPRARGASQALAARSGVADRVELARPARRRPRRVAARAARRAVRAPRASTRPSASPTSRRWPRGVPAIGCARRGRPGGDRRGRRRHRARPARDPRRSRTRSTRCSPTPERPRAAAPPHVRRSRRSSPGSAAAERPWPRTRRCCVADTRCVAGSEPYDADNLLDRHSRRATLELHYAPHDGARARADRPPSRPARRRRALGGVRLASRPPPVPRPAFRLVAADADPARVAGVLETRPRRRRRRRLRRAARARAARPSTSCSTASCSTTSPSRGRWRPCFAEAARAAAARRRAGCGRARAVASRRRRARARQPDRPRRRACTAPPTTSRCRRADCWPRPARAGLDAELHAVTYTWRRLPAGGAARAVAARRARLAPAGRAAGPHAVADRDERCVRRTLHDLRAHTPIGSLSTRVDSCAGAAGRRGGGTGAAFSADCPWLTDPRSARGPRGRGVAGGARIPHQLQHRSDGHRDGHVDADRGHVLGAGACAAAVLISGRGPRLGRPGGRRCSPRSPRSRPSRSCGRCSRTGRGSAPTSCSRT